MKAYQSAVVGRGQARMPLPLPLTEPIARENSHVDRPNRYFAFGSNMHPLRLGLRTPSARPLGEAVLTGYDLRFHMRSPGDGSGKADAHRTGHAADRVHGVVFELDAADYPVLDRYEGIGPGGAYEIHVESVAVNGVDCDVFLYTALDPWIDETVRPWRWYRDLVFEGARWQGLPAAYLDRIRRVPVAEDPDARRRREHEAILDIMPGWRPEHGYSLP